MRIQDSQGFRIQDSGFTHKDSGFTHKDSGFTRDSGFRIQDSEWQKKLLQGFRIQDSDPQKTSLGFRIQDSGASKNFYGQKGYLISNSAAIWVNLRACSNAQRAKNDSVFLILLLKFSKKIPNNMFWIFCRPSVLLMQSLQ